MSCRVGSECHVSENSFHTLDESTFDGGAHIGC